MRRWLALLPFLVFGLYAVYAMRQPWDTNVGPLEAVPRKIQLSHRCAGIVREALRHQGEWVFVSSRRYQDVIRKLDACEHPNDPRWRGAYVYDTDASQVPHPGPLDSDASTPEARR